MPLSEELVLPLVQELLCTSGTWSGWTLTLKSSSCSCANTSALARKGEKNTLLGRNEDQTALFNGSVHLCQIKVQLSCGFKQWWKHSPVMGIATCTDSWRDLDFLREVAPWRRALHKTPSAESCWTHHHSMAWCHQSRLQQANKD